MKIRLFIVLFFILHVWFICVVPQYLTPSKISHYSFSILAGISAGISDYNEYMKHQSTGNCRTDYDTKAHLWKWGERIGYIGAGFSIALSSLEYEPNGVRTNWLKVGSDALLTFALQGFFLNGAYNLSRGDSWFYQSPSQMANNTSLTDKYLSHWSVQIGGLLLAILINWLVYQ